ncbi:hypothetical protein CCMA1212_000934 [Trichoderma ghanense]|uniref:Uncharacterized protein n=1 Tax=Trichoderma ghanense TaxID=65468 RepID=A0ABY2HFL8_9HYPO
MGRRASPSALHLHAARFVSRNQRLTTAHLAAIQVYLAWTASTVPHLWSLGLRLGPFAEPSPMVRPRTPYHSDTQKARAGTGYSRSTLASNLGQLSLAHLLPNKQQSTPSIRYPAHPCEHPGAAYSLLWLASHSRCWGSPPSFSWRHARLGDSLAATEEWSRAAPASRLFPTVHKAASVHDYSSLGVGQEVRRKWKGREGIKKGRL